MSVELFQSECPQTGQAGIALSPPGHALVQLLLPLLSVNLLILVGPLIPARTTADTLAATSLRDSSNPPT